MEPDTPLSQLVLWVPPDIAAGWERLPANQQALWSQRIVRDWLRLIVQPGPPPVLLNVRNLLPEDDYQAMRRNLEAIPRLPAPLAPLPPLPEVPSVPQRPPHRPSPPPLPPGASHAEHVAWMEATRLTPEEQAQEQAYHEARLQHMDACIKHSQALNARLQAMIERHDARYGHRSPRHEKPGTPLAL